jgi:GDPmannose 4,6-dehydratase
MSSLIIGSNGQDGQILIELIKKFSEPILTVNKDGLFQNNRILFNYENINKENLSRIIIEFDINQIYFFAAESKPSEEREYIKGLDFRKSTEADVFCLLITVLESIIIVKKSIKFFYASSCLIFEGSQESPQNEKTNPNPKSNYAKNKLIHQNLIRDYEKQCLNLGLYIGIYYNHESIYRKANFFSRKVIENAVLNYRNRNLNKKIQIHNPFAIIDMSHAEDIVKNTFDLMQSGRPGDYIFSSGKGISALDFAIEVFEYLNLDYSNYIILQEETINRPQETALVGDNFKLKNELHNKFIDSGELISHRLTREWLNAFEY